jgi:hypothetical protein
VIDKDKQPVAAATAITHYFMPTRSAESNVETDSATTNENGEFDLCVPSKDDLWWMTIEAEKPGVGVGNVTYRSEQIPEGPFIIELVATRSLLITMKAEGSATPVASTRFAVKALPPPLGVEAVYVTDENGQAVVSKVPEALSQIYILVDSGEWTLRPPGGGSKLLHVTRGAPFTIPPSGDATLEVALVPTGVIQGTVIDQATGAGISGVGLEGVATGNLHELFASHLRSRTTSGDGGRFALTGLPRGVIHIIPLSNRWLCSPDGWNGEPLDGKLKDRERFFGAYSLETTNELKDVIIKVVEGATVEGSVRDVNGVPISGARVDSGLPDGDIRRTVRFDEAWYEQNMTATTDARGNFKLSGIWPIKDGRLRAVIEGLPTSWSKPLSIAPGARVNDVIITVSEGGRAEVLVLDPSGTAVEGGHVFLSEREHRVSAIVATTNRDGRATFAGLKPATYFVTVNAPPGTSRTPLQTLPGTRIVVPSGTSEHSVQLVVKPVLTGAFLDRDGFPIADGIVSVQAVDPSLRARGLEIGRTDEGGGLRLSVIADAEYEVIEVRGAVPHGATASPSAESTPKRRNYVPIGPARLKPGQHTVIRMQVAP